VDQGARFEPGARTVSSWFVAQDVTLAIAGPDRGERAQNQARAGKNRPKMKDPVSQAEQRKHKENRDSHVTFC
jgi:hypothetical protein